MKTLNITNIDSDHHLVLNSSERHIKLSTATLHFVYIISKIHHTPTHDVFNQVYKYLDPLRQPQFGDIPRSQGMFEKV